MVTVARYNPAQTRQEAIGNIYHVKVVYDPKTSIYTHKNISKSATASDVHFQVKKHFLRLDVNNVKNVNNAKLVKNNV